MIALNTHTISEINQKATRVLFEKMGIVDTFKFLNQFTLGSGDYTKERDDLFKNYTLNDIITDIKKKRKHE